MNRTPSEIAVVVSEQPSRFTLTRTNLSDVSYPYIKQVLALKFLADVKDSELNIVLDKE